MFLNLWQTAIYPLTNFVSFFDSFKIGYYLWVLAIAMGTYYLGRIWQTQPKQKISSYLFPKTIYRSKGFLIDLFFAYMDHILKLLLIIPIVGKASIWGAQIVKILFTQLHLDGNAVANNPLLTATFTLSYFIVLDFCVFLPHFLQHKIKFLWEFHKVHHSATTLNPLTVLRNHPIDTILNKFFLGLFIGGLYGFYSQTISGHGQYRIGDYNFILFLFFLFGFPLRHSHIWICYGRFFSHFFISPAMHQIHHSVAPEHRNKNLGYCLAIWDKIFGTLYVPQKKEKLKLGLSDGSTHEYQSILKLYFLPFFKIFKKTRRSR